jgi:hypothetical protein
MKRIIGAVSMLGGAACLYFFAAGGAFQGRELQASPAGLPFLSLGRCYPADAVLMLGALWGFLIGTFLVITASGAKAAAPAAAGSAASRYAAATTGRKGGTIGLFMLLNGLLLLSTLFVTYIGGMARQDVMAVGVFGLIALVQMGLGILLVILALFERPKGILALILGIPLHLVGIAIGLLAFFVWGRA